MAFRLCLVLFTTVATIVTMTEALPLCPRHLATSTCRDHMRLSTRTTVDMNTLCVDSLRVLLSTTPDMFPCTASLDVYPTHGRRLNDGPFKGKLNCTFDKTAPLNTSDLTQHFVIDCNEITKPYNYLWVWIVLGIVGGLIVMWGLWVLGAHVADKMEEWRGRRRQAAIDRAEAPQSGHPYALA